MCAVTMGYIDLWQARVRCMRTMVCARRAVARRTHAVHCHQCGVQLTVAYRIARDPCGFRLRCACGNVWEKCCYTIASCSEDESEYKALRLPQTFFDLLPSSAIILILAILVAIIVVIGIVLMSIMSIINLCVTSSAKSWCRTCPWASTCPWTSCVTFGPAPEPGPVRTWGPDDDVDDDDDHGHDNDDDNDDDADADDDEADDFDESLDDDDDDGIV